VSEIGHRRRDFRLGRMGERVHGRRYCQAKESQKADKFKEGRTSSLTAKETKKQSGEKSQTEGRWLRSNQARRLRVSR